ncbi:arabinogalactan protein 1-like [Magnolia sinica]|uniref:arabinogalactan protein 1-like n=1 Tax=Magnolia sinica TaxID=86752 RepID=UPI002658CB78|nr:arabinogalactan protein 1-like [Magnolia sinica]
MPSRRDACGHGSHGRGTRGRGTHDTRSTRAHPTPPIVDPSLDPISEVIILPPIPPIPLPEPTVLVTEAPSPSAAPVPPLETHQPTTIPVPDQIDLPGASAISREFKQHDPPRFRGELDPSAAEA